MTSRAIEKSREAGLKAVFETNSNYREQCSKEAKQQKDQQTAKERLAKLLEC
jgi:hypothetical protein